MTHRLGEFEALVLAAVLGLAEEAYGVSIRKEIALRTGRDASIGAVYTALGRLESKGLVESRVGSPTAVRGGRAKRYFEARPEGRAALKEMLRSFDSMTRDLRLS